MRRKSLFFFPCFLGLLILMNSVSIFESVHDNLAKEVTVRSSAFPGSWAITPPVIDGSVDAAWQYASNHEFSIICGGIMPGYPWIAAPEEHNGSIRLLNDNQNLYILIQLYSEDYNASATNFDELDLYFDGNGNGLLDPVEDAKYCLVSTGLEDWHYSSSTAQKDSVTNGVFGKSHTNPINGRVGNYTFELEVPLNSTDSNDIATSTNKTIGFTIAYVEWRENPEMPGSLGGIKGYYPVSKNVPGQFLQYFIIPNVPIIHVNAVNIPVKVSINQSFVLDINISNFGAMAANNVSIQVLYDANVLSNKSSPSCHIDHFASFQSVTLTWNFTARIAVMTNISIEISSPDFNKIDVFCQISITSLEGDPEPNNDNLFILLLLIIGGSILIIIYFRIRGVKRHSRKLGKDAKTISPQPNN